MRLNIDAVKNHMKYLKDDVYDREFYVALVLYDIVGMERKSITEEVINKALDIIDDYESIYDNDMRDDIRYGIKNDYEINEYEEYMEK